MVYDLEKLKIIKITMKIKKRGRRFEEENFECDF
jgi:hypothetical protein